MRKRLFTTLLAVALVLSLAGCSNKSSDHIFRYDVTQGLDTLDPQFATSTTAILVVGNVYEGLLVQESSGLLVPGVAEDYSVSDNGLVYTFQLRADAKWSNGDAVTAHDFVFAFRRIFDPEAPSPYASNLRSIQNSEAVLGGTLALERLGVRALNDHTLEITLSQRNPDLPVLVSSTYTMPCNQIFFEEQRGRYGVDVKRTLYNGPFTVRQWNNDTSINLRKNSNYVSDKAVLAAGVNLYVGRDEPEALFFNGNTDACIVSYENLNTLGNIGATYQGFDNTTWALVFNQQHQDFQGEDIRLALTRVIDRAAVAEQLQGDAIPTANFVPPSVQVLERRYRDVVGDVSGVGSNFAQTPREQFDTALEALGKAKLDTTDLLIVNNRMARDVAGKLQHAWTNELNAYINVLPVTPDELTAAFAQGNFRMALVAFTPEDASPDSLLGQFISTSSRNIIGYNNEEYDIAVDAAVHASDVAVAAQYFGQAESILTQSATVVPLYNTASYSAMAEGVQGIGFSPYPGRVQFKYAQKS